MQNGHLQPLRRRTPFGHTAILNLLELIVTSPEKQYSQHLLLNGDGWESRLKNAIYLAAVSYSCTLREVLGAEFAIAKESEYAGFVTRVSESTWPVDERERFLKMLTDMRCALQ
jgi:hypothetical protein